MRKLEHADFELPVTIAGVRFRNPFYVASGPTTMKIEQLRRIRETGWGGASLKLTVYPVPYINRRPRYGYYDREGYLAFTAEKRLTFAELLALIEQGRKECPELVLFSNITYSGGDVDGWIEMAVKCEAAGVHVNELNFGCPNMSFNVEMSGVEAGGPKTGASLGCNVAAVAEIVKAVKAATGVPVFVKLCPEGGMIRYAAKAAIDAGADAVGSNANRLAIVPLDLDAPGESTNYLQREIGLSCMQGPWALPLGKRDCYEIRRALGPGPVVTATGGVNEWRDAVEMAMCGADLVGLCTATLVKGFGFMPEFIRGVRDYLAGRGHSSLRDVRDVVVESVRSAPELTIFEGHAEIADPNLVAPCVDACPAHVPAQGYVRAVAEGNFEAAWRLIVSKNPFQSICGRICDHPCETACTRAGKDEPLRIRDIKDFVLNHARARGWRPEVEKARPRSERIAIVGAGPAGLSAAYDLARAGYKVTVFERSRAPGGMLRTLIPRFRMGAELLEEEIASVAALGVEIRTGAALGRDITIDSLKAEGYSAILIAIGAWTGTTPGIPGEDADGCVSAIDFLTAARPVGRPLAGKRVGVIGGGFTAVDAARSAVRMGAEEVYILYRRTKDEMPATAEEVVEAEEEGVKVMYLVAPKEVLVGADGTVGGLRMVNHVLGGADPTGRRSPETVEGTEFALRLDRVVFAVSQQVAGPGPGGLKTGRGGFIQVDPVTLRTSVPGVWAGGDCIGGQMDVIAAVAEGKRAAACIDAELAGAAATLAPEPPLTPVKVDDVLTRHGEDPRRWRVPVVLRPAGERARDWNEYRRPLTEDEAVAEARRCYGCGCGAGCELCMQLCNQFCYALDGWRMWMDHDKCVGCGMCIWRCPNHNVTMKQTSPTPI